MLILGVRSWLFDCYVNISARAGGCLIVMLILHARSSLFDCYVNAVRAQLAVWLLFNPMRAIGCFDCYVNPTRAQFAIWLLC